MLRRTMSWPAVVAAVALLSAASAVAQIRVVDVYFPYPMPVYVGPGAADYGPNVIDLALTAPKYFQRPFDDLAPRPGADALSMGSAFTTRAEGALAMGWNPAGLASLRERSLALDGFVRSSSGTMDRSELPDTIIVEGQPEFGIQSYTDRLGNTNGFGFAGLAGPLFRIGGQPLVGGLCYRRHINVAHGTETLFEMGLLAGTGFPFIIGYDNRERGAIYSYNASLAYAPLETPDLTLGLGGTVCLLDGRLRGDEGSRINVRGFREGQVSFQSDYDGLTFELGGLLRVRDLVRLGASVGLPYDLKVRNGRLTSMGLGSAEQLIQYRTHIPMADYNLELPLRLSGGVSLGPIKGVTASADVNHRPWSKTNIKYQGGAAIPLGAGVSLPLSAFDGDYPMRDVTSVHVGAEFEFPLLRRSLHARGMQLMTYLGYHNVPLSFSSVDLVEAEAPYYFGSQPDGNAYSFGLALDTGIGLRFHGGVEVQSMSYRKWFLDSTLDADDPQRGLTFRDPYARAATLDLSLTVLRFSTEMRF